MLNHLQMFKKKFKWPHFAAQIPFILSCRILKTKYQNIWEKKNFKRIKCQFAINPFLIISAVSVSASDIKRSVRSKSAGGAVEGTVALARGQRDALGLDPAAELRR